MHFNSDYYEKSNLIRIQVMSFSQKFKIEAPTRT